MTNLLRHIKPVVISAILLAVGMRLSSQIAIGEWRTHLPYQFTNLVMLSDERAFCSSTGGLFYYDLLEERVETLSKTDGLSDNGIVSMRWNEEEQLALLAYSNANLDIIRGNEIINIPDIMKKAIPGDKTIYDIYFLDGMAYLSCGFGIVVLDLNKLEIKETYYIGDNGDHMKINQVSSDGIYLYAATDNGVRRAAIDDPFLIDFNSWETIDMLPDPNGVYTAAAHLGDRTYVINDPNGVGSDRVFYYDGTWKEDTRFSDMDYAELRSSDEHLILTSESGVRVLSDDFLVLYEYEEGRPRSAILDEQGTLWIADYGRGLVRYEDEQESLIRPNGPFSSIAYKMAASSQALYTVSGGVTAPWNNVFRPGIFQVFENESWRSSIRYNYQDLVTLAVDPRDPGHVFAGSWGFGVVEYSDGVPGTIYNEFNSSLQNAVPGNNVVRVGGLAFDDDDNLWVTNTGVTEPISVMKSDGEWKSFRIDGKLTDYGALSEIIITEEGHMWGIIPKGIGLFALNFNGTIDDEEDDEYKIVNVLDENGRVITNEIFSIAEDLNGNIWLGTNQGVLVYYSPGRLFSDGTLYAQDIIVPRNDGTIYGDPLLQTEKVTAIEVDGSNRKWLGTADGGAFLVSENGQEQIYNFNTGNSPILSNSISDICVSGETGEVFFGTDKGLISFKGTATSGATNYENVRVFPNPVRETYDGPIAIKGLVAETTVKITDISGNLVNELESFGGQAVWDGKDFSGRRVATGTYLIFLANRDATAAHVTKILFIH